MKNNIFIKTLHALYIGISILGLTWVSILSMYNPQATMDLVNVKLTNNDAISSIRGVYGGVGISIIISLLYLYFTQTSKIVISFLTLFWGSYVISRITTILFQGALGDFGNQWIVIETVFCLFGIVLLLYNHQFRNEKLSKATI